MPYVVTNECVQCGACEVGCENDAISEGTTQNHIDITKCIECGTCERNCPSSAIIFISDSEYEAMFASKGVDPAHSP